MRKLLALGAVFFVLLAACKKDKTPPYDFDGNLKADTLKILAYIKEKNITDVKRDTTGVYYKIIEPGNGVDSVYQTSKVKADYKLSLLDGTVVEESKPTDPLEFYLRGVIVGWRIGLPKITKGGTIQLFIPSPWGYQNEASAKIPANSVLIFNVKVRDVNY
ncbi:FKBP-type peptidyl-prolyl cis-trans isomerase [Chitinophaga defluvii]|uniref:Peptidyl-prolyl cis-trans isomerase n=1 Tax=Chitinophaga defluvii TaxID=3163343 RepID=A0ABV2T0P0_9BACT